MANQIQKFTTSLVEKIYFPLFIGGEFAQGELGWGRNRLFPFGGVRENFGRVILAVINRAWYNFSLGKGGIPSNITEIIQAKKHTII